MLSPAENSKTQGLFKAFEDFPVLFKANLIFNDISRKALLIQVLFKPVKTLGTCEKLIEYFLTAVNGIHGFTSERYVFDIQSDPIYIFIPCRCTNYHYP